MNKKMLAVAIVTAALAASVSSAQAGDGTIDFTGSIIGTSCIINGGGSAKDFTVALPAVSAETLKTAGSWAGRTPFQIKLSDCSPLTGKVTTYFEPGPTVNNGTGRLTVDRAGANVEIGLLNDKFNHIAAGAAPGMQNSQLVDITAGEATLNYFAQYESLGNATPGAANSRVQYTMIYQ